MYNITHHDHFIHILAPDILHPNLHQTLSELYPQSATLSHPPAILVYMNTTKNTRKEDAMHEDYDDDYESYLDERYERSYAAQRDEQDRMDDLLVRW